MLLETHHIVGGVLVGAGATLGMDVWNLFLRRVFGVRSLDYRLLGRWVLHMPGGVFAHESIAASPRKAHECAAGWASHYLIGAGFALAFLLVAPAGWVERPAPLPALCFGLVTTLVPFLVMQPALGLGVASSRAPRPGLARLKSLATHAVFGLGLYAWARLLRPLWA